jgi:hypothetical protein
MDTTTLKMTEIKKEDFTHKDADRAVRVWHVVHTDDGGYTTDDYNIHTWSDGSFTISENGGDNFISLHGDVAEAVIKILIGAN